MVLVTGAKGQLGMDIIAELARTNTPYKGVDLDSSDGFDITNRDAVFAAFSAMEAELPTAVIHCAAYTAVDKAEDEPLLCNKINIDGTRHIAEACAKYKVKMLYISTDYVFPGNGTHFHSPNDPTGAVSVYGKSKLAGEAAVMDLLKNYFIVRISWIYGKHGNNFVKTMLRLGKERPNLNIVNDQIGSPTCTADLAPLLCQIAASEKYGIYHATNEGVCSWAQFAEEIFRQAKMNTTVNPIPTSEYPTKATRPLNSRLDKSCLDAAGFARLPHWQDALARYLADLP